MTRLPTFDPGFSTPEMIEVFAASSRIRGMLRFEAALAEAEADVGIVPTGAKDEIVDACSRDLPDPEEVFVAGWEEGSPMIPLLAQLRSLLSPEASRWLHFGATTQDGVDTGLMLQLRAAIDILEVDVTGVADCLGDLAEQHRGTLMVGRTFLQHATPTTFGLRAAQWLEPMIRLLVDLRTEAEALPVQLGGPTGNLSALGADGVSVMEGMAARLGLAIPTAPWHTDRSRVVGIINLVDLLAGSVAKIATDLVLLAQTDTGEVTMRPGGSSSMPDKRNPIDVMRAVAAATACHGIARSVTLGSGQELERGIGGWHVEWLAVPLVFHTGAAAIDAVGAALSSLEVDSGRMAARVGTGGAEAVAAASPLIDRVLAELERARPGPQASKSEGGE